MALFALLVTGGEASLGDSRSAINTGLPVNDVRVLVTDPVKPATVNVGGAGGLFKSVDSWAKWIATHAAAGPRAVFGFPNARRPNSLVTD
jgi:hypothetical protein